MKYSKLFVSILLVATIVGITFGFYTHARAQKEEIVGYLSQRFQSQNIPVMSIEVLEVFPLQLQIVVQSVSDYITPEDSINLHKVDREVFIIAYQNGYNIERYTRILQDSEGKQLYKLDQGATDIQQAIEDINSVSASEDDIKNIVNEGINSFIQKYNIPDTIIGVDVSAVDGVQVLNVQFTTSSLDEAYRTFGFLYDQLIYPTDRLIAEANAQGGKIIVCTYKIQDDKGNLLFFYFYDYQLQRGTWSSADNFQVDLGEGPPPQ